MLQEILISLLDDHPRNPRLILRDDVIEGIAAQIETSGHFDQAHALIVRPVDERYQVISGHHRKAAAIRLNLETLPCWVREMEDDEAYMQLAMGNVQGELSPLEIGRHVLGAVALSTGGRGQTGGLIEYGRQVGKTQGYITQVRQAATVFETVAKPITQVIGFLDKAKHLSAIHGAEPILWPQLVDWMMTPNDKGGTPSFKQVEDLVKQANKFSVPEQWADILTLSEVVQSYLVTQQPSHNEVTALWQAYDALVKIIKAHQERLDPEVFTYTEEGFREWLKGGIGTYAWDARKITEYRRAVIQQAQEADKPRPVQCQVGEWYGLGQHRLFCGDTSTPEFYESFPSAAFAFADPPYNADAADWDSQFKWGHDWLTDKAKLVAVTPGIRSIQSFFNTDTAMKYVWSMSCWIKNGMTRGAIGFGNWIYIALFANQYTAADYGKLQDHIDVTIKTSTTEKTDHKGRKPHELLQKLIESFTQPGGTLIDPFLGSGTTLFVAHQLGRICIGGEINPEFCSAIIDRWHQENGIQAIRLENP